MTSNEQSLACSTYRTDIRILGWVKNEPTSPPIVLLPADDPVVCYLLAWEMHERDGSWWAYVTWPRVRNGQSYRHVTSVRAERLEPLESAEVYAQVPRRVLGRDGEIRPWSPPP
jgi:hypothetical protein